LSARLATKTSLLPAVLLSLSVSHDSNATARWNLPNQTFSRFGNRAMPCCDRRICHISTCRRISCDRNSYKYYVSTPTSGKVLEKLFKCTRTTNFLLPGRPSLSDGFTPQADGKETKALFVAKSPTRGRDSGTNALHVDLNDCREQPCP